EIFNLSRFQEGEFYVMIPNLAKEDFLYDFKTGGRIFPYSEPTSNIVQTINYSEQFILNSIHEYLNCSSLNYIGLLDYYLSPTSEFIRKNECHYYLLDNKLFYFFNRQSTAEEIRKYFGYVQGYFFFISTFQLPKSQKLRFLERSEIEN